MVKLTFCEQTGKYLASAGGPYSASTAFELVECGLATFSDGEEESEDELDFNE